MIKGELTLIGHRWSRAVHDVKDFLARSRVPYRWLDIERSDEALRRYEELGGRRGVVVQFPDGDVLVEPEVRELAARIGLDTEPDAPFYDLIVVGGGPAGLSAAIYAASEGIHAVVIERETPGGQAGQSARIENYLGFPGGLSGGELARRGIAQAERFGAEILATRSAVGLRAEGPYRLVTLDDGRELVSHAVLIAAGVSYRWLDAPGCPALVGAGIYYGAASAESSAFAGQDVYLLGGGNSAGQAALELARHARRVIMLVLEESIGESMSRYLVERIEDTPNVSVRTGTTVVGAEGGDRLEALRVRRVETEEEERVEAHGLFVFIGATPDTEWLGDAVQRDEKGFLRTGADLSLDDGVWPLERAPHPLETSIPGVFVAGDVRHGSVKRLGAAAGEGAAVVQYIHAYCAER